MARQIHSIVENANDVDNFPRRRAIHDEAPSAPAFARDMQRSKAGPYIVPPAVSQRLGTCLQCVDRFQERLAINVELSFSEIFQNVDKVPLGLFAEPYAPRLARQFDPAPATISSARRSRCVASAAASSNSV